MTRLRTHNRRRLRAKRHDPVCCPKHRVPYRGDGWVYAGGYRFALFECPRPLCKRFELVDAGGVELDMGDAPW